MLNIQMIIYGLATLVSAILVWLNIFYNSDVIRVGNRVELICMSCSSSSSIIPLSPCLMYHALACARRNHLLIPQCPP